MSFQAALAAARPASRVAVRSTAFFSTSASASASSRQILIQLTATVDGLGFAGDRIYVAPGYARNNLVPSKKAMFLPWKRASDRAPRLVARPEGYQAEAKTYPPPSEQLVAALTSLPPTLTFTHIPVAVGSSTIHGSVSLGDVLKRLEAAHGVAAAEVRAEWVGIEQGDRIKELGKREAKVYPLGETEGYSVGVSVVKQA